MVPLLRDGAARVLQDLWIEPVLGWAGGEPFDHGGTLDSETTLKIAGHIFCADKGSYYDIPEDVPTADQDDPQLTTQVLP